MHIQAARQLGEDQPTRFCISRTHLKMTGPWALTRRVSGSYMADVFISYSRSDKEFVLKLRNALEASNHVTWLDLKDIPYTAEWRAEIYANIEAANNFLCVLSPNFITSPNCRDELAHAVECKKRLVPIVRRDVDFDAVPPDLAKMQSIPFQEWRDFNDALKKLIDALDTDLDYVRMSTRLLVRAHEWESKARNPSFTLRGKDLEDSVLWLAEGATKKPSPTALHTEYISASKRNVMIRRRYLFSISGLVSVVLVVALVASVVFQLRLQRSLPANVTTLPVPNQEVQSHLLMV